MFGELAPRERGTVFLDEVGDLPPAIQTKLLRVLEDRCVLRIGERVPKKVDVRFVAATNRDLRQEIARRSFREDLYYRLSGVTFTVPLLRERRSESLPLAEVFATRARVEQGHSPGVSWSPSARELLEGYDWPGNVRELKNAIERAVVLCAGSRLEPAHLPPELCSPPAGLPAAGPPTAPTSTQPHATLDPRSRLHRELALLERERILEALQASGGNQSRAAEHLGMSRRSLVYRLSSFGLTRTRKRD